MMAAAERAGKLTPQFMAALADTLDTPCSSTIVVAGGHSIMVGGGKGGEGGIWREAAAVTAGQCSSAVAPPADPPHLNHTSPKPPLYSINPYFPPPRSAQTASQQEAGKGVGMLTLGVPPSVALRGGFSAADGIFDGYGPGGGLTWQKAKRMLETQQGHQGKA